MRDRLRQHTPYWDALAQPAAAAVTLAAPPGSGRVTPAAVDAAAAVASQPAATAVTLAAPPGSGRVTPAAVDAAAAVASHRPYTLVLCVN